MKYKIKYDYNTGDSFHEDRDQISYLECIWTNLEIAKNNLRRIKEHYEYYCYCNTFFSANTKRKVDLVAKNIISEYYVVTEGC